MGLLHFKRVSHLVVVWGSMTLRNVGILHHNTAWRWKQQSRTKHWYPTTSLYTLT